MKNLINYFRIVYRFFFKSYLNDTKKKNKQLISILKYRDTDDTRESNRN